jgi:hypothetical protein
LERGHRADIRHARGVARFLEQDRAAARVVQEAGLQPL